MQPESTPADTPHVRAWYDLLGYAYVRGAAPVHHFTVYFTLAPPRQVLGRIGGAAFEDGGGAGSGSVASPEMRQRARRPITLLRSECE
jgi:hypothetical protein